jgi:general secretion pathway protein B
MSSILKALQKLEQEKAGRVTREPDIHSGITRRNRQQSARPRWILPLSMLAVAVISITITYLLMKGENQGTAPVEKRIPTASKGQEMPTAQQTSVSTEGVPPIAANNPTVPPARNTGIAQQPKPQSPRDRNQDVNMPVPAIPSAASPSREAKTSLSNEQTVQPNADTSGNRLPPQPRPAITINGIAWQQDSAARIAVVNGVPVSEGSSVQGMKVEEIFPDRIRFSHNGKPFEAPFGKGEHQ